MEMIPRADCDVAENRADIAETGEQQDHGRQPADSKRQRRAPDRQGTRRGYRASQGVMARPARQVTQNRAKKTRRVRVSIP